MFNLGNRQKPLKWANEYITQQGWLDREKADKERGKLWANLSAVVCLMDAMGLPRLAKYHQEGTDFEFEGLRCDVQNRTILGLPKEDYECQVRASCMGFDQHILIFTSLNKISNQFTVCGWATKPKVMRYFVSRDTEIREPGQIPWTTQEDMYRLKLKDLTRSDDMTQFKGQLKMQAFIMGLGEKNAAQK